MQTDLERFYHFVGDEYFHKDFEFFGHICREHPVPAESLFTWWIAQVKNWLQSGEGALGQDKYILTTDYILKALAEDSRVNPELEVPRINPKRSIARVFRFATLDPDKIDQVIDHKLWSVDEFMASDRPAYIAKLLDSVENYAPDFLKEMVQIVMSGKDDPRFAIKIRKR